MLYRNSRPREAKKIRLSKISTPEDKFRRHRNKSRIWRRCVAKLALTTVEIEKTA